MQIEVNAEGFKVRIKLEHTWSRWYNGTEFAGVRNLVRSAEQTKFWIEQELRRANSVTSAYNNTKHNIVKSPEQTPLSEIEKQYENAKRAKEKLNIEAIEELKKELGMR